MFIEHHVTVSRQLGEIMDDTTRIERATPQAQAVVSIEHGQRVEQRFFAFVKGDMPGEKENTPVGKQ
ncbi:MAG: hypothetical protein ACYC3X_25945 [Pirellulaceae bacterium]